MLIFLNKTMEELQANFKNLVNYKSDNHAESSVKDENKPRKVQSPITNKIANDLETHITDRSVPYCSCIYKMSKFSRRCNRDKTRKETQTCSNDCVVFERESDCIRKTLDPVLSFK